MFGNLSAVAEDVLVSQQLKKALTLLGEEAGTMEVGRSVLVMVIPC